MSKAVAKGFVTIAFLVNAASVAGQAQYTELDAPSHDISSDFGPRNIGGIFDFHEGVDYNPLYGDTDLGAPITSVESGNVNYIRTTPSMPPYWIEVAGSSGRWMYMHIFQSSDLTMGSWELRPSAVLQDPYTGSITRANIIILWSAGAGAEKVLSTIADRWVQNTNGSYVLNSLGGRIRTKRSVLRNEVISPMGNSGASNAHLHLGLNYPSDNPLCVIHQSLDTLPIAEIEAPIDGQTFYTREPTGLAIKVLIDSTGGLDLDKVDLMIYRFGNSGQPIHLGPIDVPTFGYGGRPGEGKTATIVHSGGNVTGVQPFGATPGKDRFVFVQDIGSLNLPEGEHWLGVSLVDVKGNVSNEVRRRFRIVGTQDVSSPATPSGLTLQ